MRKFIIAAVLALCLGIGLFAVKYRTQNKPVRIGFVAALSGRLSQMGVSARNGVELAIDDMNRGGGVLGRTIVLVAKDNKGDLKANFEAVRELLDNGVNIIVAPFTSKMAEPAMLALQGKNALIVTPTVSADALKDLDDNFLRITTTSSDQARQITAEVLKQGCRTAAVVYDSANRAYTEPLYLVFKKLFETAGKTIVYTEISDDTKNSDFFHIAKAIEKSGAEALLLITSGIDAAALCQQIQKTGSKIKIFGSSWVKTNDLLEHGGKSVEGILLVSAYESREKTAEYLEFEKQYLFRFKKKPNFVSSLSYEAAQVIFSGIQNSRSTDPKGVKMAILKTKHFKGLEETFTINEFGDAVRKFSAFVVREGKFERVDRMDKK
ncbi:MAG: amino acid ABC transporter substrate-binding protein [Desulfobacteraceae bacterium]|nr:amino acid ABC transporter substrate-binding protein [Desulfobacteraceae bacterium]